MDEIIALVGPGSCGKTSTLNMVYRLLTDDGGQSTNRQQEGGNRNDFSDIVIWRERRIAFYTMGDYSRVLMQVFRDYDLENIDTLICACNDRLVRPMAELQRRNATVIVKIPETDKGAFRRANEAVAGAIFNRLQ